MLVFSAMPEHVQMLCLKSYGKFDFFDMFVTIVGAFGGLVAFALTGWLWGIFVAMFAAGVV